MSARIDRSPDLPVIDRLPYFPGQALARLAPVQRLVFVGAKKPVTFFGYEGLPSELVSDEHEVLMLATPEDDTIGALTALADALGAAPDAMPSQTIARPERPSGALNAESIAAALVNVQPEGAIIVDEGITTSGNYFDMANAAAPHTYLRLSGGAIGFGIPAATGAAVACPDRPVINIQADGSASYTLQALWTQAREQLNIKTLICNNRRYNILQIELMRAGIEPPGQQVQSLTNLDNPAIDWRQIAKGFGVPAVRVERAEDLTQTLENALSEPGPCLIEMIL
jgi:acetolactate synthase-1/2/3 large subunit